MKAWAISADATGAQRWTEADHPLLKFFVHTHHSDIDVQVERETSLGGLFPDAPIVLMRRDPVETCLSLYRQEFSRDWAFVHDLADLGRAYGLTARLAAHWARALPGRMIEVQYETLAEDFAAEARRIVAACGLDWDAACESPSKSPRPIATFSTVSARSPVRVMNDRAEAYRPYLGGLIGALEAEGVDLTTGGLKAGVESGLA